MQKIPFNTRIEVFCVNKALENLQIYFDYECHNKNMSYRGLVRWWLKF